MKHTSIVATVFICVLKLNSSALSLLATSVLYTNGVLKILNWQYTSFHRRFSRIVAYNNQHSCLVVFFYLKMGVQISNAVYFNDKINILIQQVSFRVIYDKTFLLNDHLALTIAWQYFGAQSSNLLILKVDYFEVRFGRY